MSEKFGTVLVDPPWPYRKMSDSRRASGFANFEYEPMSVEDLAGLPVDQNASRNAVLLLWATWPMLREALQLIDAWRFEFVTGLPWIKTTGLTRTAGHTMVDPGEGHLFKPAYGVGYWMRGCSEPLLVAKRPKGRSVRTPWMGLLCDRAQHSQKPESVYELAESFPSPRLELFARRERQGWTQFGDALDGRDIRKAMAA